MARRASCPGYDAAVVFRFLSLALPLVLAIVSAGHFVLRALGWAPPPGLPVQTLFGGWLIEAVGLTALFLLIHSRGLARVATGLGAAWTAWLFRGPVLVVTVASSSRLPADAWWRLVIAWFVVYTVSGIVLAALAPVTAEPVATEPAPWPDEPQP